MIRLWTPLIRLVAVVLVLLTAGSGAIAQTVTWTGGGDGVSWNQATNWSSNPALPGAANDVVIPAGAQAITFNTAATIRSLTLDRALNIPAQCTLLTITNGLTFTSAAGVLTTGNAGCEQLRFSGTQSITGPGEIVVSNANMRVTGASTVLTLGPSVTIRNNAATNGQITFDTGVTVNNQGAIRATGVGRSLTIAGGNATTTLNNSGTLEAVSSGTLTINDITTVNTGSLVINTGNLSLGGVVSSLGTVNRTGGSLTLSNGYTGATLALNAGTGSVNFAGGTFNGTTITASDGAGISITGATSMNNVTLGAPISIPAQCITLTVTGGLAFQPGGSITTGNAGCEQLRFSGTQSVTGTGEIVVSNSNVRVFGASAVLTLG
ncbi:MAG: hypothetical protein ACREJO_17395, partial [Phycisphaerales bacterium]